MVWRPICSVNRVIRLVCRPSNVADLAHWAFRTRIETHGWGDGRSAASHLLRQEKGNSEDSAARERFIQWLRRSSIERRAESERGKEPTTQLPRLLLEADNLPPGCRGSLLFSCVISIATSLSFGGESGYRHRDRVYAWKYRLIGANTL